ncbi:hypothetical protein ACK1MO_004493 [Salmonella enterica]
MDGTPLTQQDFFDIVIGIYKLSTRPPYQLHIVCKKRDGFSLNKIGENM